MGSYGSIPRVDGADAKPDVEQQQQEQQTSAAMSLAERVYAYDLTWSTKLYQRFGREPTPRLCWEIFSHSGDGFLWILTIPPLMGLLWAAGLIGPFEPATKMLLSALFTVMTVDIIAIMLLKMVFHRQRPPFHEADMRFVGPDQHSFPSGHSTRVWAMVAMLVYLADTHPWILREFFYGLAPAALVAVAVVWALVINFSRVALGRHYPTDVLAGSLIGFFVFWPISLFFVHHYGMLDAPPPPY
ncbi:phosphatidic acid phosphatase [Phytophthora cinnamomi]|uniref:phosphatidic acid phosphatase n=1 Tax=Phytophthora cinnamomi TaxID=4785 RepID=UPI00355A42BB|nr:phosphatidic acid phosphatase [Phytophthora cinnamomi]